MTKLSVLLAKTDQLAASFKQAISDAGKFFAKSQGSFKGSKKTYEAYEGTIDDPTKRGVTNVVTTVDEKLEWIEETATPYIDALFSQEATNATGKANAELVVDGIQLGKFSTLELMRLKSLLESQELNNMYSAIPVREETKTWVPTTQDVYRGRKIFEDIIVEGESKTTEKEQYILPDPNLSAGKTTNYVPQVATKNTVIMLGKYTSQNFSGEASHRERAEILRRVTRLKTAVLEALKQANDVEAVESDMTAQKLFNYLHRGK